MNKKHITTYSPNSRINDSLIHIFAHFFNEIKMQKWQIWIAFKKDFVSSYNQTVLGLVWAIILPIIPISAYLFLGYMRVLRTSADMPFVVYIVTGMTIWFFITDVIVIILNSIQKEKGIISKINYPVIAVILSNFGAKSFDLVVRLVFVIFLLFFYNIEFRPIIFLLPLYLIPVILFSVAIGMIACIFNEIYKDTKNIIQIFIRYGIFLSSVIFPMPKSGIIGNINVYNPFNTFIVTIRDLLIMGKIDCLEKLLYTSAVSLLLFIIANKLLYVMEYRLKAYL